MAQVESSVPFRIAQWAARQLADYDAHNPGTLFADGVVLSVAEGYAVQSALAGLRRRRGEQIIGYKVGCTSPKIRAQLGIDHCVTGRLFDSERHQTGAVLSRAAFANLAIEGELAVELSHAPTANDFSEEQIPACVARVFPVIELHNHILRGQQPSAGELVANNAIHAGFVAGGGVHPDEIRGELSLAIFANEHLLEQCAGPRLMKTICSSLHWLMEHVRERGETLSAGQVILTGSIPSLMSIAEDCRVRVDASPLGSVDVKFV